MTIYCVIDSEGRPVRWGNCAPIDYDLQPGAGQQVIEQHPPSEQHRFVDGAWILLESEG